MKRRPDVIFIIDVGREDAAVHEANLLGIPIVALVDTNCNPLNIDYVIPSNDDAIRAIKLLVAKIADAVLEGKASRKDEEADEKMVAEESRSKPEKSSRKAAKVVEVDEELGDDALLGEATLAKLDAARKVTEVEAAPAVPATPAPAVTEVETPVVVETPAADITANDTPGDAL
jgi:small subunit ribosomal protein S2